MISERFPFSHASSSLPVRLKLARCCVVVAVCATSMAWVVPGVHAQAPSQTAGARQQDDGYRRLIQQALMEFKLRNWPEARALFRRAHAQRPSARTLRGLGMVSYEMRDYPQAVRELSAALQSETRPLTDTQRTEVTRLLDRAQTFVGRFRFVLEPVDAQLRVDGEKPAVEQDGRMLLGLGQHEVVARADGYQPARRTLEVQGGESREVRLQLTPVVLESQDESADVVDRDATLVASAPVRPEPQPESGRRLRWTWVALGASAAFGAAAAAVWYTGEAKLDDLESECAARLSAGADPCVRGGVDTDEVELHEKLTNASLGLSAAALIAAGVLAVFEWPREERPSVAIGVGPGGASVRGSF